MKYFIMFVTLVATVSLATVQTSAQEYWYWQLDPGNSKMYRNADNSLDIVMQHEDGQVFDATIWRSHWEIDGIPQEESAMAMSVDAQGNCWFHLWMEPLVFPDDQLLFVEAPLEVGNTWNQIVEWNGVLCFHVITAICEEDVDVPYGEGTYCCCKLQHEVYIQGNLYQSLTQWYHCDTGLVQYEAFNIPGWGEGMYKLFEAAIPVATSTWGGVKNLYR